MDRFKRLLLVAVSLIGFISDIANSSHSLGLISQPNHHHFARKSSHHHTLAKRAEGTYSGKATFYATGLGACGQTNVDSDFIVALNSPQYTANKWCFKDITIYYGGKSAQAKIADQCPGCAYGSLDLSPSLFKNFASEAVGVFYMSWSLNDGATAQPDLTAAPAKPAQVVTVNPPVQKQDLDTDSSDSIFAKGGFFNSTITKVVNTGGGNADSQTGAQSTNSSQVVGNNSTTFVMPTQEQIDDAFALDGNLDTLSQLIISFGSLTTSSAHSVISGN